MGEEAGYRTPLQAESKEVIFSRWQKVGRRETGKNPLTSGHPEMKYSGGWNLGLVKATLVPQKGECMLATSPDPLSSPDYKFQTSVWRG